MHLGRQVLKSLWEKKKMLVTSIFSFYHNIYIYLGNNSIMWKTSELSTINSFNSINLKIWPMVNSRFCTTQVKCWKALWEICLNVAEKIEFIFDRVENTEVKKENGVLLFPQLFNPFPYNDTYWRHWEKSLLKTLWEKEKLLVTSSFSFSHSVFYPFGWLSAIFIQLEIVVCKLFQFGRV